MLWHGCVMLLQPGRWRPGKGPNRVSRQNEGGSVPFLASNARGGSGNLGRYQEIGRMEGRVRHSKRLGCHQRRRQGTEHTGTAPPLDSSDCAKRRTPRNQSVSVDQTPHGKGQSGGTRLGRLRPTKVRRPDRPMHKSNVRFNRKTLRDPSAIPNGTETGMLPLLRDHTPQPS